MIVMWLYKGCCQSGVGLFWIRQFRPQLLSCVHSLSSCVWGRSKLLIWLNLRISLWSFFASWKEIFLSAFFDIMIHLVLHFSEETILGGPIYMQWMYPFERYIKKLKDYMRNTAKPEGSIVEGYVVDETLTFCSRYFDDVETRFNRPDRNDDGIHSTR